MITTSHGILAYWFNQFLNRRLKTKVHAFFIVLGSVIPDFFHVANAIIGWLYFNTLGITWHSEFLIDTSKALHSFTVFTIVFTLSYFLLLLIRRRGFYYGRTVAFFCGWGFFHILIDIITHRSMTWPYLWPWPQIPMHGFIDHLHPLMIVIEIVVTIASIVYILNKKFSQRP
ncbi:MAG: hypothetical protein Q7S32_04865 [bacterium]|nr:hypothetical protein [bacterium]